MLRTPLTTMQKVSLASMQELSERMETRQKEKSTVKKIIGIENKTPAQKTKDSKSAQNTLDKATEKFTGPAAFDHSRLNATEIKAQMLMQLAEELGVNTREKSDADIGKSITNALQKIHDNAGDDEYQNTIKKLEKNLGLDRMGISLGDFIKSFTNPDSKEAQSINAVFEKAAIDYAFTAYKDLHALHTETEQDIGIYAPSPFLSAPNTEEKNKLQPAKKQDITTDSNIINRALLNEASDQASQDKLNLLLQSADTIGVETYEKDTKDIGKAIHEILMRFKYGSDKGEYESIKKSLEETLGLDKLGISLDDFVKSFTDPNSHEAKKVNSVFEKMAANDSTRVDTLLRDMQILHDTDSGLYQPLNFPSGFKSRIY